MKVYFDACVIIDLGFAGDRAAAILMWVAEVSPIEAVYSDFGRGEVVSALAKQVRDRRLSKDRAKTTLSAIDEVLASWQRELIQPDDIMAATDMLLRFDLNLRLPDAIHAAVALRMDAGLVSSDKKLVEVAAELGCKTIDPHVAA